MFFFCKHKYELFERIESCEHVTFISKCKHCGNMKKIEATQDKHKWKHITSESITNRFDSVTGFIHIHMCEKCKDFKTQKTGIYDND